MAPVGRGPLPRASRTGMTLIEMLVVLAIVAVMSTIVVLGLGATRHGADARTEANRLAEQLGVAVDEALVTGRPVALSWDAKSYGFVVRTSAGRWVLDEKPVLGKRHALPRGLTLSGDAPSLLPISGDGPASQTRLSIAGASGSWSIDFDGLTANTRAGPA